MSPQSRWLQFNPWQALTLFMVALVTLTSGCARQEDNPLYAPSAQLAPYQQASFSEYVQQTQAHLAANRVFLSSHQAEEVALNSPWQRAPAQPAKRGILLVHGLGDSPYYFTDLAEPLLQQGFIVRSLLLPGHGTRPADLMLPQLQDWQQMLEHQLALLQQEVDEVWLGGYSTGANLVTSAAIQHPNVAGLLLFSPGFVPGSALVRFAPWISWVMPWADQDPALNPLRYDSLPMQGAALYYQSVEHVQQQLKEKGYNKPTLMVLSEGDSVLDSRAIAHLFDQHFSHPASQLLWLGDNPPALPRLQAFSMKLPELRISQGSHMSPLFSAENPYYGRQGSQRICNNGQSLEAEQACQQGATTWYGPWGYQEPGKIHARLSWNPYFSQVSAAIQQLLSPLPAGA
ncbi:alpha/beta hydrolase [Balneatrix alpica]|uniref:alpha/beta hydrolase n=1 Tax=Balneatrix alpica TaxID=75684 RepID=UPI00273969AC|nr:alpha/beta fold hydrolase [Balneatrix alpica]